MLMCIQIKYECLSLYNSHMHQAIHNKFK